LVVLQGLVLATLTVFGAVEQRPNASERVLFHDVSIAAGLVFTHVNGASPDKHFAEIMGSGGLFFDFDNDGGIDVFLVDGDPRPIPWSRTRHATGCFATGGTAPSTT